MLRYLYGALEVVEHLTYQLSSMSADKRHEHGVLGSNLVYLLYAASILKKKGLNQSKCKVI